MLEKLTPEQEALIPVYRDKWKAIALSTEPINRQKATEAVKAAYAAISYEKPKILVCDNPYLALQTVTSENDKLGNSLSFQLKELLESQLESKWWKQPWKELWSEREQQLAMQLGSQLMSELGSQLVSQLELSRLWKDYYYEQEVGHYAPWLDFCISVLNFAPERRTWKSFQSLVEQCGWIFPYEKTCIICARPIKLSFDRENRLHAEGEPAIQFADGYDLYSYQGVTLPKKYGTFHPHQWQAKWILEELNAEVRRLLIQEIGYARICQELKAQQLDSWAEYTLLKIDNEVDVEPVYLLKMTCPSTGFVHALRVPPNIQSAREAIRWVNWGTDPEEFSMQT